MEDGTIMLRIVRGEQGWPGGNERYKLGTADDGERGISAFRNADRSLEIRVAIGDIQHTFSGPMPDSSESEILIVASWTVGSNTLTLYVNGTPISKVPLKPLHS